ncbi:msl9209 (plasmid) [Mesorhizobium japonicum MAFF 303099]|uniref:Msl9209 protein n=1 Tax=Mesorhizobium japonicum (strain LMG 29417 / CECT 9101 / MAFF 303099) TaxID=266835 RepID=Q981W4_RHILO|nr:msl9209 [Mesorhizobium japonicum MAFF 303099]
MELQLSKVREPERIGAPNVIAVSFVTRPHK